MTQPCALGEWCGHYYDFEKAAKRTNVRDGDPKRAMSYFKDAAGALELTLEDIRVEEMLSSYLGSGRGVYFDVLIESLLQEGRVEEAFDYSERARARAFLQLVGNTRLDAHRGADPQLVREAEALRTQLADWERQETLAPEPQARRLRADVAEARRRYEALLLRVKSSSSEYASVAAAKPLTVGEIRAEVPPETTLISYFVTSWGVPPSDDIR